MPTLIYKAVSALARNVPWLTSLNEYKYTPSFHLPLVALTECTRPSHCIEAAFLKSWVTYNCYSALQTKWSVLYLSAPRLFLINFFSRFLYLIFCHYHICPSDHPRKHLPCNICIFCPFIIHLSAFFSSSMSSPEHEELSLSHRRCTDNAEQGRAEPSHCKINQQCILA